MKRVGEDRELHFKQLMLEQIGLEVHAAAWLVIQQEPASIQLVDLLRKASKAYEVGAMHDVIRLIYHQEAVVIEKQKSRRNTPAFYILLLNHPEYRDSSNMLNHIYP